ncbi:type VII secretion-associated protein [Mycobacterium hubeiense]|uniref:type VII secretion-associated protein n=1 Tax=Mycobacterium hubeiense TaxID=1867256 RepID=UPI000C7F70D9|nr:type VII secretion-associated protein [Mycobacterium sp. QGD 101]
MSGTVVEAGPVLVRGIGDVPAELAATALECIDDEIALVDDQPVAVAELWCEVLRTAAVLVVPTWWTESRVDRVRDAAPPDVTVLTRIQALGMQSPTPTIVEMAPDLVVVARDGVIDAVIPRIGDVAEAVTAGINTAASVLVDAPVGVECTVIIERLRADGIAVCVADSGWPLRVVPEKRRPTIEWHDEKPVRQRTRRAMAVLAGTLAAAAGAGGAFVAGSRVPEQADVPMTLLVEGRVGVMVPAAWTVQRITSGPGSARVQVVSPVDAHTALHITQSAIPAQDMLHKAFSEQPAGVFVDFNPNDRRAGRPVATYREVRDGHTIEWALIHDAIRIGIGCQAAPGSEQTVRHACEQAVRSAHAVF